MISKIVVRTLNMEDYDGIIALWSGVEGLGLSEADSRDNIGFYLERNPGLSWVATVGKTIVGAVLCGHDGRRGFLHHLAVSSSFRGRGIGRRLVDQCLAGLEADGIRKCHLFAYIDNHNGMSFWTHLGFQARNNLVIMSKDIGE